LITNDPFIGFSFINNYTDNNTSVDRQIHKSSQNGTTSTLLLLLLLLLLLKRRKKKLEKQLPHSILEGQGQNASFHQCGAPFCQAEYRKRPSASGQYGK